jgi:hypothetical protein
MMLMTAKDFIISIVYNDAIVVMPLFITQYLNVIYNVVS